MFICFSSRKRAVIDNITPLRFYRPSESGCSFQEIHEYDMLGSESDPVDMVRLTQVTIHGLNNQPDGLRQNQRTAGKGRH
jgi:hypothetical protein